MNEIVKETRLNPDGVEEEVVWIDIKGYEGIYAVNQFGQVKSHAIVTEDIIGRVVHRKEKLRITHPNSIDGGHRVCIQTCHNHNAFLSVRRLVAQAFLGLDIDRKDLFVYNNKGDPNDSYYRHLTVTDSTKFLSDLRNSCPVPTRARPVVCVIPSGKELVFDCTRTAAKYFGIAACTIRNSRITKTPDYIGNRWYDLDEKNRKKFNFIVREKTTDEQIISAYKSGMHYSEIVHSLHINIRRFYRVIRRYLHDHPEEEI